MKLTTGYKKPIDSDGSVLLAGGGHKTIQLIINDYGAMSITPAITFSLAINADILGNASTADRLKNDVEGTASTGWNSCKIENGVIKYYNSNSTYNFGGTTFYSGDSGNAEHNANSAWNNGHYYYTSNGPSTDLGASTNDGALYVQSYNSSWVGLIALDYRNGRLFVRGKNNGTWQAWQRIAITGESQPANGGTSSYSNYTYVSNHISNNTDYYMTWVTGYDSQQRIYASSNGVKYNPANRLLKLINYSASLGEVDSLTAGNLVVQGIASLGTITSGVWNGSAISDSYISSAATWNAKQAAISDLSTIRSNASNGNTAYGWGNHSGKYLPLSGGTVTGHIKLGENDKFVWLTTNINIDSQYKALLKLLLNNGSDTIAGLIGWHKASSTETRFVINATGSSSPWNADQSLLIKNNSEITWPGTIKAAQGFYQTSDIRKKKLYGEISIDKVYDFLNNCNAYNYTLNEHPEINQIGVIAQEIEQYFPEIVNNDKNGMKSVAYDKLSVILLRACKDINERLKKLENGRTDC